MVLISRIPFLYAGYGSEEDSWGIVLAAQNVAETGNYEVSRLPGHPFEEFIYFLNAHGNYFYYNFLSAIFSVAAVLFFALTLKKLRIKNYLIGTFAFAFTPVFYVCSTYTIDYVWSLAFILISFYVLLEKKLIFSGIFLGFAIGCRITAACMLLPFAIILFDKSSEFKKNLLHIFKLSLFSLLTTLILFVPIISRYGAGFFMFYDQFSYPPISKVIYKATFGVFGIIGTLGIFYAKIIILINKFRVRESDLLSFWKKQNFLFSIYATFLIYIIEYLWIPYKSGYIIPIIPFLIIFFGYYLTTKQFKIFCCSFILSPFLFGMNLTDDIRGSKYSSLALKFNISHQEIFIDPIYGNVISEYSKRKQKMVFTDKIISKITAMKGKFVVICGWWYNEIAVKIKQSGMELYSDKIVFYINEYQMESYVKSGCKVYFLPEQDKYNDEYSKINSTLLTATPFPS